MCGICNGGNVAKRGGIAGIVAGAAPPVISNRWWAGTFALTRKRKNLYPLGDVRKDKSPFRGGLAGLPDLNKINGLRPTSGSPLKRTGRTSLDLARKPLVSLTSGRPATP